MADAGIVVKGIGPLWQLLLRLNLAIQWLALGAIRPLQYLYQRMRQIAPASHALHYGGRHDVQIA
jgi:hypothetical protein